VVSWREMALSDMRAPAAPPTAAPGVDRTSLISSREDSIFAMLFKPEDEFTDSVPDVASSSLFRPRSGTTLHTLASGSYSN